MPTLADAEQRAHAEFLHFLYAQHLDFDAEFSQPARAAREFLGVEHVRRLVHEFARDNDAIDDVRASAKALRAASTSPTASKMSPRTARILAVLLFGFVAIEFICPQPHAGGDRGGLIGLHGAALAIRR